MYHTWSLVCRVWKKAATWGNFFLSLGEPVNHWKGLDCLPEENRLLLYAVKSFLLLYASSVFGGQKESALVIFRPRKTTVSKFDSVFKNPVSIQSAIQLWSHLPQCFWNRSITITFPLTNTLAVTEKIRCNSIWRFLTEAPDRYWGPGASHKVSYR